MSEYNDNRLYSGDCRIPRVQHFPPKFPPPPSYYQYFTEKNITEGRVYCPPPLPSSFTVFGKTYDLKGPLVPTIESQGIRRFFSEYTCMEELRIEMKKLNTSIIATFLDLVQLLIDCPDSRERYEKIELLRLLFLNFHQLINELRPVEARHCVKAVQLNQNDHLDAMHAQYKRNMSKAQSTFFVAQNVATVTEEMLIPREPRLVNDVDLEKPPSISGSDMLRKLIEDATGKEVDQAMIDCLKKAKKERDDEEYMLKHWKEPPEEEEDDVEENGRKTTVGSDDEGEEADEMDVDDEEEEETEDDSEENDVEMQDDEAADVVSREIPGPSSNNCADSVPFYDRQSFANYVLKRGIAPDLDTEAVEVRTKRRMLTSALRTEETDVRVAEIEAIHAARSPVHKITEIAGKKRLDIGYPCSSSDEESGGGQQTSRTEQTVSELTSICAVVDSTLVLKNNLEATAVKEVKTEIYVPPMLSETPTDAQEPANAESRPQSVEMTDLTTTKTPTVDVKIEVPAARMLDPRIIPVLEEEAEEDEPRHSSAGPTGPSPVDEQPPVLQRSTE